MQNTLYCTRVSGNLCCSLSEKGKNTVEPPDIANLSSLQSLLSNLTGISLSLYSEKGEMLLPPAQSDNPHSVIRASSPGREEYTDFLKTNIEKAILRTEISWITGPSGQWHFIAPLREGDTVLTVVGEGFDLAREDFDYSFKREGPSYERTSGPIKSASQAVRAKSYVDVQETARHIRSVFTLCLKNSFNASTNEKRYRLLKTILAMIPEITPDKNTDEIYGMLADILLFFFNAESISVMAKDEDTFMPLKTAGRFKDHLQALPFPAAGFIARDR